MTKITRRGLLKAAVTAVPALATIAALGNPPKKHETWSWNTNKETFHFIGYLHDAPSYHKEFVYPPEPEKEFPEPVDAVFDEEASPYLNPKFDLLWQAISEGTTDNFNVGPTLKYCREKNI